MHILDDVIFRHHHQIGKEVAAKELQVKLAERLLSGKQDRVDVMGEEEISWLYYSLSRKKCTHVVGRA